MKQLHRSKDSPLFKIASALIAKARIYLTVIDKDVKTQAGVFDLL